MRKFLTRAFVDSSTQTFRWVGDFLAVLTIISIIALVLETVPTLEAYENIFLFIEWGAVFFFSLEYIGRIVITKPRQKYIFSFFGIVDLVSVLPTFLGLGNFTFLKSARAFRIIRLLRMARLAKIGRSGLMTDENTSVLTFNILIYLTTLVTALLVTGTAMYLTESESSAFVSIPAGMWWSLKVFMAGIPVTEPQTDLGWAFFVLTRFIGLLLFGLLVGVVGNIFRTMVLGKGK